jgi:hypothetical protein
MHNEQTTDRMIASFLSRKAEQFPEIFSDQAPEPSMTVHTHIPTVDIVRG